MPTDRGRMVQGGLIRDWMVSTSRDRVRLLWSGIASYSFGGCTDGSFLLCGRPISNRLHKIATACFKKHLL